MGIPEFSREFSFDKAQEAYNQEGAIILRHILSEDVISYLRHLTGALFSIFDMKVQERLLGMNAPDDPYAEHVERFAKFQFIGEDIAIGLLCQAHLAHQGFRRASDPLLEIVAQLLPGHDWKFVPGSSAFRRQGERKSSYVTWHRDAHAVRTAEFGDCLNCWVPIDSVGMGRPSLEVIVGSNRIWRERPIDYSVAEECPAEEQLKAQYGSDSICTAILDPRDVLIFDHHTLHRTQEIARSHPIRISGEFRFASKSDHSATFLQK